MHALLYYTQKPTLLAQTPGSPWLSAKSRDPNWDEGSNLRAIHVRASIRLGELVVACMQRAKISGTAPEPRAAAGHMYIYVHS